MDERKYLDKNGLAHFNESINQNLEKKIASITSSQSVSVFKWMPVIISDPETEGDKFAKELFDIFVKEKQLGNDTEDTFSVWLQHYKSVFDCDGTLGGSSNPTEVALSYLNGYDTNTGVNLTISVSSGQTKIRQSTLGTQASAEFSKRIKTGTKVIKATGSSTVLFTDSEIFEMFPGCNQDCHQYFHVSALNGDGAANGVHFDGVTHLNGNYYVVFGSSVSGTIDTRIDYLIIYTGQFTALTE